MITAEACAQAMRLLETRARRSKDLKSLDVAKTINVRWTECLGGVSLRSDGNMYFDALREHVSGIAQIQLNAIDAELRELGVEPPNDEPAAANDDAAPAEEASANA